MNFRTVYSIVPQEWKTKGLIVIIVLVLFFILIFCLGYYYGLKACLFGCEEWITEYNAANCFCWGG